MNNDSFELYLGDEWLATAVSIAITFIVFIMGVPALLFQTFIADAYRNIYNERFEKKWSKFFLAQIILTLVLFVISNKWIYQEICGKTPETSQNSQEWHEKILVFGVIIVIIFILVSGFIHLRSNFKSSKNIDKRLSKEIVRQAKEYFDKHGALRKKDMDDLAVLAKELEAGTQKMTFLDECETLLEHLLELFPKSRGAIHPIRDLLKEVISLSITYDGAKFNQENIRKVMDLLNLAHNKVFQNDAVSPDIKQSSSYLKSNIANCIKEIAVKAMINNDLNSVMDAVSKLSVIEGTANEMFVLGNQALRNKHVQTAVMVVKALGGKLHPPGLHEDVADPDIRRTFFFWFGLIAKVHPLGDSAREFAERQLKFVLSPFALHHRQSLQGLLSECWSHFYKQADFHTCDAVKSLAAGKFS